MRDNLHSHVMAWLKVLLPMAALALLSTLFLLSRRTDPVTDLPISDVELELHIETRGVEHGQQVVGALRDAGYTVRVGQRY